ncbi:MAG: hypothetical protein KF850_16985 [Labilithrix sp.]|nr:hypothetical protein [Labilithrix sp.]
MTPSPERTLKAGDPESMLDLDAIDVDIELELDDELELTDDDFVLETTPAPPISRPAVLAAAGHDLPRTAAPSARPISEARLQTLRAKALDATPARESLAHESPARESLAHESPARESPARESLAHESPAHESLAGSRREVARESRRASSPRKSFDSHAESSVADECLASIAAAASDVRASDPRMAGAEPSAAGASARSPVDDLLDEAEAIGRLPPLAAAPGALSSSAMIPPTSSRARLPRVCPPPFHSSPSLLPSRPSVPGVAEVAELVDADAAETLPVPARVPASVRRLAEARARATTPFARTSPEGRAPAQSAPSVAPVAVASAEPTVIVVRDRPRTAWVVAAAAIGALAAVTVMRFGAPSGATLTPGGRATEVVAAPPGAALISGGRATEVVAAAPVVAPPSAAGSLPAPASSHSLAAAAGKGEPAAAIVDFGGQDGVSIALSAPAEPSASAPSSAPAPVGATSRAEAARPSPKPAARPARPSRPKAPSPATLPDGSLDLASSGGSPAPTAAPSPAAAPSPSPAAPTRKRALTPEQQLAEAQLRAATR